MNKANPKKAPTDEARVRMREGALARYDRNAQQNHDRVRAMLSTIEAEMSANQGIYPHNSGSLSLAEVARRSEIHPFTFHKPRYIDLATEVKGWLEKLKSGNIVGRTRVRKEMGTRVQEWKQLYVDLLDSYRLTEADLDVLQSKLDEALKENEILRQRLLGKTGPKVVSFNANGK